MTEDIRQWLIGLDLAKYVDVFMDNEVGMRDLPAIGEDDLRELGLPLGPRKRILTEIEALAGLSAVADNGSLPGMEAERRQVTVLFADISRFTAISERLGAEATHDLLNSFFAVADAAVLGFGGTIDKHIGDAVMAVFSAPIAHTDDPERAIRAAVSLSIKRPRIWHRRYPFIRALPRARWWPAAWAARAIGSTRSRAIP